MQINVKSFACTFHSLYYMLYHKFRNEAVEVDAIVIALLAQPKEVFARNGCLKPTRTKEKK